MNKKDLKSKLQKAFNDAGITPEPPLAAAYRAAVVSVCGEYVRVGEWDFPKFELRQKELDENGIDYGDFAASVVKTWWGWCKMNGMRVVSAPIFCGPKAYARYMRDLERHPTVRIDSLGEDVHIERVTEEYLVATAILGWYPEVLPGDARSRMTPLLKYPAEPDIVEEVLKLFNEMYHTQATSYIQLAKELRRRREQCQESSQ